MPHDGDTAKARTLTFGAGKHGSHQPRTYPQEHRNTSMSKQPAAARTPTRDDASAPGSRTGEGKALGLQLALDAQHRLHDGLAEAQPTRT